MNIILIIIGFLIATSAARNFVASGGQQSDAEGLVTLLMQIGGIGMIIWGITGFF